MQVGEQNLAFAQHLALARLRLLDLDDHFGALEDLFRRADDLRAILHVDLVADADAIAGVGLDQHLVAVLDRLAHARRRHADAVFVVLDFLGYAYQHDCSCSSNRIRHRGRARSAGRPPGGII